jgi:hypothetical protein
MVVIKLANYRDFCPFTKTPIRHNSIICLFNKKQYEVFIKTIKELLNRLPDDLIDLIIEKTKYKKYIGRFGHHSYTHWSSPSTSYIRKKAFNTSDSDISDSDISDSDTSNSDTSDNDLSNYI